MGALQKGAALHFLTICVNANCHANAGLQYNDYSPQLLRTSSKLKKSDSSKSTSPDVENVEATAPLRLDVAARLAFPDGSMKVSGLRREIARGRLACEMIAGKLYTTLADIDVMRTLCRRPAGEESHRSLPSIDADSHARVGRQSDLAEGLAAQQRFLDRLNSELDAIKKKRSIRKRQ